MRTTGNAAIQAVGAAATPATPPTDQFRTIGNHYVNNTGLPYEEDNSLKYGALNLAYDFHWATLTSATSYGKFNLHFSQDVSNANLQPGVTYGDFLSAPPIDGGVYRQPTLMKGDQVEYVHKFNQELRLSSDAGNTLFGHGFDWQVGGFFTHESTTLTQPYEALDATDPQTILTPALGGAIIPADYKEHSVFADITYHFNTAFDLELGGRNTDVKQSSQVNTFCCVLYGPTETNFPAIESSQKQHHLVRGAALARQRGHACLCTRGDGLSPRRPEFPDAHLAEPALVQIGFDQELRDRDAHRPVR